MYISWPLVIFCFPFSIFFCHLVDFVAIWHTLLHFGRFCGHLVYLVCCIKKNLATLVPTLFASFILPELQYLLFGQSQFFSLGKGVSAYKGVKFN
jgi:hypothetical protein